MLSFLLAPVFFLLSLLIQAFALKLSLGFFGKESSENRFSTALGVSFLLSIVLLIVGAMPFLGVVLKPLIWMLVVMLVYRTGFLKTLGVAVVQVVIQAALKWILAIIGIGASHLLI